MNPSDKVLEVYETHVGSYKKFILWPSLFVTLVLGIYVALDVYDEYFKKPFSNVELVSVTPVEGGYTIRATFEKNTGEFVRLAPIVYQDGIPVRGSYVPHNQPDGVSEDRLEGKQYLDITVLTDVASPERIVIKVEHELLNSVGVTYKETNDFLVIDQLQMQGISK